MKNKTIRDDINQTISYSLSYGIILNNEEIYHNLISNKVWGVREVQKEASRINVNQGHKEQRMKRFALAKLKYAKKLLSNTPMKNWVELIGVTGSVSSGYARKKDDIDIVIITKPNRLWLYRIIIKIWLLFRKIPHRRWGKIERKNDLCFNLWLDTKGLKVPKHRQDLKRAWDLLAVQLIYDKNDMYSKWLCDNKWATKYMATPYHARLKSMKDDYIQKETTWIISWLNKMAFWIQKKNMVKKIIGESIDLHFAYFHNN